MGVRDKGPNPAGKHAPGRTTRVQEEGDRIWNPCQWPPPSPPAGTQRLCIGCRAAGWGLRGLEMGSALRHAGGWGGGLVRLQLWNFALAISSLGYAHLRHHMCPHPSLMQSVCVQRVNRGADSGTGCTLHPHPASARLVTPHPSGWRQNGAPVKCFQLQLEKFSFGQPSPWAGLVPPGQGSLGDADPSSKPIGSVLLMETKLTAGSCSSPASHSSF